MERKVFPGEFYRHFKNKLYQIITIAIDSESGEPMVVYQALYDDFRTYVRPLDMFLSEVDRDKYPQVEQQYRFEQVEFPAHSFVEKKTLPHMRLAESNVVLNTSAASATERTTPNLPPNEREGDLPNPDFLRFLEAETPEAKMACLEALKKTAGQSELDSIYVALDMKPQTGTVAEQLEDIRRYLNMQKHYDGGHLR